MKEQDISDEVRYTSEDDAWINTFSGAKAYPLIPQKTDYRIEDIAHSLSLQCRWNGHTSRFYSIAQHCCYAYDYVDSESSNVKRMALMHDASEAYLTDVARPLKPFLGDYKKIEFFTERLIYGKYGITISTDAHNSVKDVDTALLVKERGLLINAAQKNWGFDNFDNSRLDGLLKDIPFWSPKRAELEFLYRFYEPKGVVKSIMRLKIFALSIADKLASIIY